MYSLSQQRAQSRRCGGRCSNQNGSFADCLQCARLVPGGEWDVDLRQDGLANASISDVSDDAHDLELRRTTQVEALPDRIFPGEEILHEGLIYQSDARVCIVSAKPPALEERNLHGVQPFRRDM